MGRADGHMHTLSQEPSGRTAVGRGLGGRGNCWSDGGFPASIPEEGGKGAVGCWVYRDGVKDNAEIRALGSSDNQYRHSLESEEYPQRIEAVVVSGKRHARLLANSAQK